jgi:hypothetical protein
MIMVVGQAPGLFDPSIHELTRATGLKLQQAEREKMATESKDLAGPTRFVRPRMKAATCSRPPTRIMHSEVWIRKWGGLYSVHRDQ